MAGEERSGSAEKVIVEPDVVARMRDGTRLRADVYRPARSGRLPTLLTRTPYGKHVLAERMWDGLDPVVAARRGFVVVVQDTRGRFASEGEWDPLAHERDDGYDSVEWAAALPASNGRVGLYGGSYCGNAQWMPAIDRPPSLAAISPFLTWSEPMDGLFARGGAVELGITLPWSLLTGFDHLARLGDDRAPRLDAMLAMWDGLGDDAYWELPVAGSRMFERFGVPELGGLRAAIEPGVAERCRVAGSHASVDVPSLNTAGWYDCFLQGTLDNFEAMRRLGRDARLIVGPWAHEQFRDPIGSRCFGLRSWRDGVPAHEPGDWNDYQLAWMEYHLGADQAAELPEAPVRIFVMGRNEWRDETSWPPARAREERWFLHSSGALSTDSPVSDATPSTFTYDPADPVPTLGGQTLLWPGRPPGPFDQGPIEARPDVLVFTSAPLERDLEVTGRVRVVLHAQSSAPSTDWVVRLCDVQPDGTSFNLCDGIYRVTERADACGRYEIDLWSTSNVFMRDHRLRVHVTSSSFPRWDRNLNTGDQQRPHIEIAHQMVWHDLARAAYIELPVIGS